MKKINLHNLRCVIGAKATSLLQIKISTLSDDGSTIDLHFPADEAMQLNEYLSMNKVEVDASEVVMAAANYVKKR